MQFIEAINVMWRGKRKWESTDSKARLFVQKYFFIKGKSGPRQCLERNMVSNEIDVYR